MDGHSVQIHLHALRRRCLRRRRRCDHSGDRRGPPPRWHRPLRRHLLLLQATEEPASQRSSECSRAGKASRGGTDGTDGGGGPGTSGGARVRPPAGGGWAVLRIVRPGPHTLPPCSFDSCWRWRTLTSATRAQQKPPGAKFCAVRPRPTPVPLPSSPPEQHGGHRRAGRIVTDEGVPTCRAVVLHPMLGAKRREFIPQNIWLV